MLGGVGGVAERFLVDFIWQGKARSSRIGGAVRKRTQECVVPEAYVRSDDIFRRGNEVARQQLHELVLHVLQLPR